MENKQELNFFLRGGGLNTGMVLTSH